MWKRRICNVLLVCGLSFSGWALDVVGTIEEDTRWEAGDSPVHMIGDLTVAANATLIAPELNRRKEPLEAYPLDTMAMVGSLVKTGQPVALVRVDNLLYQVKVGAYLGQNYGRVMKVTETEVVLREIVQDATGDWIERPATLQLQEKSK